MTISTPRYPSSAQDPHDGFSAGVWRLLQISDSAYPTGAYAHSQGLEGMVEMNLFASVPDAFLFLRDVVIPAIAYADAPFFRHAYRAVREENWQALWEADELCHALRLTRELRSASSSQGAQRVRIAAATLSSPLLRELERALDDGKWKAALPVASGAVSAALSIPEGMALTGYLFQSVSGYVAALVKLLRIGQTKAQQWTAELGREGLRWLEQAERRQIREAGWLNPIIEIASARHETMYTRLFIS